MVEMKPYSASSKESEIDALLDELIAKIMDGSASAKDLCEYQEQLASRTRLMRPHPYRSTSARRAATGIGMRRKYA